MVSITINRQLLNQAGLKLSDDELKTALPRVKGSVEHIDEKKVDVELTSDRPDLWSARGVARALKGLLNIEHGLPLIKVESAKTHIFVNESILQIRPVIAAAFARSLALSEDALIDIFQLQEKLSLSMGRRRKKLAIGIHDAAAIKPPLRYEAASPREELQPLGWDEAATLGAILKRHEKGIEYGWILKGFESLPVIRDAQSIISFPPIINAESTRVTTQTCELFIEVTGSDESTCNAALAIICRDLADSGASIESVEIRYPQRRTTTPNTKPRLFRIGVSEVNRLLGTSLSVDEMLQALLRCRLGARAEGDFIAAEVPPWRIDFLHPIDLVEEVAIGYGYDRLEPRAVAIATKGGVHALTNLSEAARDALANACYIEANLPILISSKFLKTLGLKALLLKNPVSEEYDALRPSVWPSLLLALSKNTHRPYPQRIFEVGEAIKAIDESGATLLACAAASAHAKASLTEVASLAAHVAKQVGLPIELRKPLRAAGAFIKGRVGALYAGGEEIGFFGEVHPSLLTTLGLPTPVALFELRLAQLPPEETP